MLPQKAGRLTSCWSGKQLREKLAVRSSLEVPAMTERSAMKAERMIYDQAT